MVIDLIQNVKEYQPLLAPALGAGLDRLLEIGGKDAPAGRYEFEGGYLMIQEGETKPAAEGRFEYHKNYVDVQILLSGSEELSWGEISTLTPETDYAPEKDAGFLTGPDTHIIRISEGMFYLAFPTDGHKSCVHSDQQQHYKKCVMKLPVR